MTALRKVNEMAAGTNMPRIPEARTEAMINRESLDLLGIG